MITDQTDKLRIVDGVIETHYGEKIADILPVSDKYSSLEIPALEFPVKAYISYEVYNLRVFHYANEWYISTRNKLDAFDCFWGNKKSLGAHFESILQTIMKEEQALDLFLHSLDKGTVYHFLIPMCGNQNIGNVNNPSNKFWLAAVEKGLGLCLEVDDQPTNVWLCLESVVLSNKDELKTYAEKVYDGNGPTGLMICGDKFIHICADKYLYFYNLRDNAHNIKHRAIQLYLEFVTNTRKYKDVEAFVKMHLLFEIVDTLRIFIARILELYISRYISKQNVVVSKCKHAVLKNLHRNYLENGTKISRSKIARELLDNFNPEIISKMLEEQ